MFSTRTKQSIHLFVQAQSDACIHPSLGLPEAGARARVERDRDRERDNAATLTCWQRGADHLSLSLSLSLPTPYLVKQGLCTSKMK